MSDEDEDVGSAGKQKSIFSGMGRVRQMNHFRDKWSPKPKASLPDRSFVDAPPSSPWSRRANPRKDSMQTQDGGDGRDSSVARTLAGAPKHQRTLSVVDMERYLTINSWLEQNGIDISQAKVARDCREEDEPFDEVYTSLETLEKAVESELSHLNTSSRHLGNRVGSNGKEVASEASSPAIFDYLAVIGADMTDITIRNFRNREENVLEATVAFAHPPESQFNAESIEHFCFPTGVKLVNVDSSSDKGCGYPNESASATGNDGDFFVLMISGGGTHGQNVQYALCMRGLVKFPGGGEENGLAMPICYCLVAQIPLISFFRAVLQRFFENIRSEFDSNNDCGTLSSIVTNKHARYIDDIVQEMKALQLPGKGCSVPVDVFSSPSSMLTLARPNEENEADEKVTLLLQWSLPLLLSRLPVDRVLEILGFLLVEMKVIIVSNEISLLSSTTLGLASLLHPLTWAGPLISVLPPFLHEYMEAPVPLICGIDKLPIGFECLKGTCTVHLDGGRVQLHPEDERAARELTMPGSDSLARDLTRFTKQMAERVTRSAEDKIVPFAIHLAIRRVRRHIEHLLDVCTHATDQSGEQSAGRKLDESEMRFIDAFMQTQMYQKYQDDQPTPAVIEKSKQPSLSIKISDCQPPMATVNNNQHDSLKSAASLLFQIALTGSSSLQQDNELDAAVDEVVVDNAVLDKEVAKPLLIITDSPVIDPDTTKSSPAVFTPKDFPLKEPVDRHDHEQEAQPTVEVKSLSQPERRLDQSYVWPVTRTASDRLWMSDDSTPPVLSPNLCSFQNETLPSLLHEALVSPRRNMSYERSCSGDRDAKSVGRTGFEITVSPQRADTETTMSVFETTLSEAPGSADTDDGWLFDGVDEQVRHLPHSESRISSDCDREFDEEDVLTQKEENAEDSTSKRTKACVKIQRCWRRRMLAGHDEQAESLGVPSDDSALTSSFRLDNLTVGEVNVLTSGINVASRGAWDGWCKGRMFISPDLTSLTWERRTPSFSALNMHVRDITGVTVKDSPNDQTSSVQFHFRSEEVCFQFRDSPHHDDFFHALQQLVQPTQGPMMESTESFPYPATSPPRSTAIDGEESAHGSKTTPAHPSPIRKQRDIDQFKTKLQRGFMVEKHGRRGRPHARLIVTDAECECLMWKKPPPGKAGDWQQLVVDAEHRNHRQSFARFQAKSIAVASITAIVTGKQTTVFRRSAADKTHDRLCLSVLTPTRTLDICAYSLQEFQELYRGFSLLLEEAKRARDMIS